MSALLSRRVTPLFALLGPAAISLCWARPTRGGAVAGEPWRPALDWSETTESPRPGGTGGTVDPSLAAVCPATDGALGSVATTIAARRLASPDAESLVQALRAAGSPHLWPRALTLSGQRIDPTDAASRLRAWLGTERPRGARRCGVGAVRHADGTEVVTAVAIDAEADLDRVPVRARVGSWITVNATALVPAIGAKVVLLGPTGPPRPVPTSFANGRVSARANVDRRGAWLFQVLLHTSAGPHPVLEATVFAGVDPPAAPLAAPAPGEALGRLAGDPARLLLEMVNAARASEGLAELARDEGLGRVAKEHAERMMRARRLDHDIGEGDPRQRVEAADIAAREVGENVAHAASLPLAHRATWSSPSHRANLLERRFGRLGVGVATDADGTVWAAEVFASDQ